jgi:hypothetical protein
MKTIRETKVDKAVLRLVEHNKAYTGLVISNGVIKIKIEGYQADEVWRQVHDEVGKANPKYFGFDGARARFLKFFPNGFHSDSYASEERNYKLAAKAKLDSNVPLEAALTRSGFGEAALAAFRATNLLSPFEKTRLQDVLRGPAADTFIRGSARFAAGDIETGLTEMAHALKPYDSAKWTVVTYLPFLWRPEAHMFLKPEVTKDFAARVGHRFASDYSPKLEVAVYRSLIDVVDETEIQITDLEPRDRIDIQSFIWIIGDYKDDHEQPRA